MKETDLTSPNYGKFIKTTGTGTELDGKYVDDTNNILVEAGTHFFDPSIIPAVEYQVFGMDNVWFWDNEGQYYNYKGGDKATTINIKVITGTERTYQQVSSLKFANTDATTGGTVIADFSAVPADAVVGDLFYTLADPEDPTSNRTYKVVTAGWDESTATTGGTKIDSFDNEVPAGSKEGDEYYTEADTYADDQITSPYEFNKYGKEELGKEVLITLTLNQTMVTNYPGAIISINGKEHDIKYTSFKLYMNQDYRISIHWIWGEAVETFRIICNR